MNSQKAPIAQKEYSTIFAIIDGLVADTPAIKDNIYYGSFYYNFLAMAIINEKLGLSAEIKHGIVVYNMNRVFSFGSHASHEHRNGKENAYTWLEVDGWLVDFFSPNLGAIINKRDQQLGKGDAAAIKEKYLIKDLSLASSDSDSAFKAGGFFSACCYQASAFFDDLFNQHKNSLMKDARDCVSIYNQALALGDKLEQCTCFYLEPGREAVSFDFAGKRITEGW